MLWQTWDMGGCRPDDRVLDRPSRSQRRVSVPMDVLAVAPQKRPTTDTLLSKSKFAGICLVSEWWYVRVPNLNR
jgi:hypothetical protein